VHKNDKQFVCDKCDARFSWRTTWKRHVQNHVLKAAKKKNKKRAAQNAAVLAATGALSATVVQQVPATATVVSVPMQSQLTANVVQLSDAVPQLTAENLAATLDHASLTQTAYVHHLTQTVQHMTHQSRL